MFTDLPILAYINSVLKLNAENYTTFHTVRSVAWSIKPVYGLIGDLIHPFKMK